MTPASKYLGCRRPVSFQSFHICLRYLILLHISLRFRATSVNPMCGPSCQSINILGPYVSQSYPASCMLYVSCGHSFDQAEMRFTCMGVPSFTCVFRFLQVGNCQQTRRQKIYQLCIYTYMFGDTDDFSHLYALV